MVVKKFFCPRPSFVVLSFILCLNVIGPIHGFNYGSVCPNQNVIDSSTASFSDVMMPMMGGMTGLLTAAGLLVISQRLSSLQTALTSCKTEMSNLQRQLPCPTIPTTTCDTELAQLAACQNQLASVQAQLNIFTAPTAAMQTCLAITNAGVCGITPGCEATCIATDVRTAYTGTGK